MLKARLAAAFAMTGALVLASQPARAQCLDYAAGFGVPGLGLGVPLYGPYVRDMLDFDFGSGPRLVVAGRFQQAGGVTAAHVAVWDGSAWSTLGAGFLPTNDVVYALAEFDDGSGMALYAGGSFTHSGAASVPYVAKWNGTTWTAVGGGANNAVAALTVFDDGTGPALYAAGTFTQIGGVSASCIARWNGTTWAALGSGLTRPGSQGPTANYLAAINDGTASYLAIAGSFTGAGGLVVKNFVRWTSAGFDATSLGQPGSELTRLAMHDDGTGPALYAASFGATNIISRRQGATWATLGTFPLNGNVYEFFSGSDANGPALFIGGSFRFATASQGRSILKYQGGTLQTLGTGVEPGTNGEVYALAAFGAGAARRVYVGGSFESASGHAASSFVPWGETCGPPTITQQPADRTASFPSNAVFQLTASGTAPLAYQWRKNGIDLVNVPQRIEGATTNQLTLLGWSFHDSGNYDCVVTNAHGSVTSQAAVFTVPAGGFTNTPVQLTKIFGVNEPVPGVPGAVFELVISGAVCADDSILSLGVIPGNKSALCRWSAGTNQVVHKSGDAAPGTSPGVTFTGPLGRMGTRDTGDIVLNATLAGAGVTGENRNGIWRSSATGATLVARTGAASPDGVPGNVTSQLFQSDFAPALSAGGAIAYFDRAKTSGGAILPVTLRYVYPSGAQEEVFHVGGAAPGMSSTFTRIDDPLFLGSSDTIACSGLLASGATAVWVGVPGDMTLAQSSADPAPGFPAGTTLNSVSIMQVSPADDRFFIFAAPRESNGTQHRALYEWTPIGLKTVASDLSLPAPSNAFWNFWVNAATANGDVLFIAEHTGDCATCPSWSLYLKDATGLQLIAANRSVPHPEIPSNWGFQGFLSATMNAHGEVIFGSEHSFGDIFGAAFGWTRATGVFPIAVPGTQIEVSAGQYKTVRNAYLCTRSLGATAEPRHSLAGLNDAGVAALTVEFSDFDRASYVGQFEHLASLYVLAPIVISAPESLRVQPGESVELTAIALGQAPLAYQWRKDGVDVFDGATYSGSQSATLSIVNASESDAGAYTLFVSNVHGVDESAPGVLLVQPGETFCSGDGALADHTTDCPCGNHGDPGHGCAHSFDPRGARLAAHGSTTQDDVVLHAEFTPADSFTLFLQHDAAGDQVFHDGVLCASGHLVRLRGRAAAGGESFFPNTNFVADSLTLSQRGGVYPGQGVNRFYSAWYRNAATTFCPPASANVSNGCVIGW